MVLSTNDAGNGSDNISDDNGNAFINTCTYVHVYLYMYVCVYIYIYIYIYIYRERERYSSFMRACHPGPFRAMPSQPQSIQNGYIMLYYCIIVIVLLLCIYYYFVDSASLPFKFLTRLPGVCSGGEGTPPETLKCLTPNPYS